MVNTKTTCPKKPVSILFLLLCYYVLVPLETQTEEQEGNYLGIHPISLIGQDVIHNIFLFGLGKQGHSFFLRDCVTR